MWRRPRRRRSWLRPYPYRMAVRAIEASESKQTQLVLRLAAVQENKRGGPAGADAQALQIGQFAQLALAPRQQDRVGALGADARHAQQAVPVGAVELHRLLAQVLVGPTQLWVLLQRQPACARERQVFQVEAIVAQQKRGLVQAVLAPGIFGRVVLQGRSEE